MTNRILLCILASFVACTEHLHAQVRVSDDGTGQALIFPFYTVEDGWSTLITVGNTTDEPKGFRVIVRGARAGRVLVTFAVYLAPRDVYSAAIYDPEGDDEGAAALTSRDNSCTVPFIANSTALPPDASGSRYVSLLRGSHIVDRLDDGRDQAPDFTSYEAETRSGYVEVLEVGVVTGEHGYRVSNLSCSYLQSSMSVGSWNDDPSVDMEPPSGGVIGNFTLINPTRAQAMSGPAVVIDGLFTAQQHTATGDPRPSLAAGEFLDGGETASLVYGNGAPFITQWGSPMDAVNAILMKYSLSGTYYVNSTLSTDWVVSMPTMPGKLIGTQTGADIRPFLEGYGQVEPGKACQSVIPCCGLNPAQVYDADGEWLNPPVINKVTPPWPTSRHYCAAVNRVRFGSMDSIRGGFVEPFSGAIPESSSGLAQIYFRQTATTVESNPNEQGVEFVGLPIIGFSANTLVTDEIVQGVAASFASIERLQGQTKICADQDTLCRWY